MMIQEGSTKPKAAAVLADSFIVLTVSSVCVSSISAARCDGFPLYYEALL